MWQYISIPMLLLFDRDLTFMLVVVIYVVATGFHWRNYYCITTHVVHCKVDLVEGPSLVRYDFLRTGPSGMKCTSRANKKSRLL